MTQTNLVHVILGYIVSILIKDNKIVWAYTYGTLLDYFNTLNKTLQSQPTLILSHMLLCGVLIGLQILL